MTVICRAAAPVARPVFRAPILRQAASSSRPGLSRRIFAPVKCAATTAELPQSLQTLVRAFQSVPDPMARYKQLLFYATKLAPLPAEAHTEENKVKGCVSQVWVVAELRDGRLYWQADSDSQLTKGLAALLVQGLSGCSPEEVVHIPADFIASLGLQQSLTPSRNNGFLNMFKLMQKKALEAYMQQQQQQPEPADGNVAVEAATGGNGEAQAADGAADVPASSANGSSSVASNGNGDIAGSATPVADSIRRKLTERLQPVRLDVIDNSNQHAGHMGYRGSASYSGETHFNLEVVSAEFEGLTSLKRHRLIYQILEEELRSPVHALSLVTKTPQEAGLA